MASICGLPTAASLPSYGQQTAPSPGVHNETAGPSHPSTTTRTRLKKPIVIPTTTLKPGSPYLRAYPPSLEEFAISKEVFVQFLNDLNRGKVIKPPAKIPRLAGNATNLESPHEAQTAGESASIATKSTKHNKSKSRARKQIRKANRDLFNPHGLQAEITKLATLARIANIPILNPQGRINKDSPLLFTVSSDDPTVLLTSQEGHLQLFSPWIAPLDFTNLPSHSDPPRKDIPIKSKEKSQHDLTRITSKHDRQISKLDRRAAKALENPEKSDGKLAKIQRQREKAEKKYDKKLGEVGETNSVKDQDNHKRKESDESKGKTKSEKSMKHLNRGLWLVIRNLDGDSSVDVSGGRNGDRIDDETRSDRHQDRSMNAVRDRELHEPGKMKDENGTDDDGDDDSSDDDMILTPETSEEEDESEDSESIEDGKHK